MTGPDRDPQYDEAWQQQMAFLRGEEPIDPLAQQRVIEALRNAKFLRQRSTFTRWSRRLLPVAAALLLFLAGGWWGRTSLGESVPANSPRFVLLLLEDSTFQGTKTVGHDSLVSEYSAWAGGLAEHGQLVLGEELGDEAWSLGPVSSGGASPAQRITGLFILSAASDEAALAIARTCPHLRYGGGVLLRPIQPS